MCGAAACEGQAPRSAGSGWHSSSCLRVELIAEVWRRAMGSPNTAGTGRVSPWHIDPGAWCYHADLAVHPELVTITHEGAPASRRT